MTKAGLTLNQAKCKLLLPSVEYLGHVIDQHGVHPSQEKVKAIKEAPEPHNISELRSFLGIINHYARFLPNLSTKKNKNAGLVASWMLHSNQYVRQYYSEHCNRDVYIITSKITQLNHENFYSKRNLVIENFSS